MDTTRDRTGRRLALLALLGVALVLGGAGAALPRGVFWHSDEGAKFLQLLNLRLTPSGLDTTIRYPGRAMDPALRFVPFHPKQHRVDAAGGIQLQWPIFLPLITWPFYALAGLAGLSVWPLTGALAACWLSYRLACAVGAPPGRAWLAIPILGLGTPLGFYSWVFFEHTLAAALVAGAVLLVVRGLPVGDTRRLLAAGLTLGAAIYLRSELYVLVPILGGVVAWRVARGQSHRRVALAGLLGLGLALLPLWTWYTISEGGPLPQHATWYFDSADPAGAGSEPAPGPHLPPLRYLAHTGLGLLPDFLAGPDVPTGPPQAPLVRAALLLGTLLVLLAAILPHLSTTGAHRKDPETRRTKPTILSASLRTQNSKLKTQNSLLPLALALLAAGSLPVLLDPAPYGSLHGFVLAAPLGVLAAATRPAGARGRATLPILGVITGGYVVLHVLVISALSGLGPISRYEWGQRYLLPAYPLLVALAVAAVTSRQSSVVSRQSSGTSGQWAVGSRQSTVGSSSRFTLQVARLTLALALLLGVIGVGFEVRGWVMLRDGKATVAVWQQALAATPDTAVVTDAWWLPLTLAPQFYAHAWFLAPDAGAATAWPARAQAEGLPGFSVASLSPALAAQLAGATPRVIPGAATTVRGLTVQRYRLAGATSAADHKQPEYHARQAEDEAAKHEGGGQP